MIHDTRLSNPYRVGVDGEAVRVFYREGIGFGVLAKRFDQNNGCYAEAVFDDPLLSTVRPIEDIKLEGKIWTKDVFDIGEDRQSMRLAIIGINEVVRERRRQMKQELRGGDATGSIFRAKLSDPQLAFAVFPMK